ncbi:MAG: protein TolR [Oligoflexia bacterium]|nr:protein TolR [Oligoflexia bacterium]
MGMSSGSDIKSRTTMSEINVTPLVDVMLVLLIIFMITAPMLQQGIDVQLPETANTGLTVREEPFVITVRRGDKIFIEAQEFKLDALKPKLTAIFENREDKQVYIQADKDVSYGFVAATMGEIKAAGINGIGLVTLPKNVK